MFGVELFLLQDGQLLLNEVAPRPHNSGANGSYSNVHCRLADGAVVISRCKVCHI